MSTIPRIRFRCICLFLVIGPLANSQQAEPRTSGKVPNLVQTSIQQLGVIENDLITESSGLALSLRSSDILWTHNDSGDVSRIFALDLRGRHLGEWMVEGVTFRDAEDIAAFESDGKSWLLIGDIGDNSKKRGHRTLYLIEEPTFDPTQTPVLSTVAVTQTIEYRYEDGPQDCETLAVDPDSKTIYLVEKNNLRENDRVATIYELPWPARDDVGLLVAKPIGTMSYPAQPRSSDSEAPEPRRIPFMTTAGDISRDGTRFVVLTYTVAYEYIRAEGQSWAEAFRQTPRKLSMPARRQGESICYAADGRSLYLTSERLPSPLWEVRPLLRGVASSSQ